MITNTTTDNERSKFIETSLGSSAIRTTESAMSKRFEYDAGNNIIYMGVASAGSNEADNAWLVKQFIYDVNGNLLSIKVSNGVESFNSDWVNRATHTYS